MLIVGNGFISKSFASLRDQHPDVLLFGSGVSNSLSENTQEFRREADLLYSAIRYCQKHIMQLVYFSSAGMVYGNYEQEVREDGPVYPRSSYGRHKLAMEAVIQRSQVRYVILRLSNPVGPNQQLHQLLPSLREQVRRGFVEVWSGAHRDLIDIEDVVRLTDGLLSSKAESDIYNMASGYSVPVEDIVNYLEQKLGVFVLRNYVDRGDAYRVRIDKLCSQVEPRLWKHFNPNYYKHVLDKYILSDDKS